MHVTPGKRVELACRLGKTITIHLMQEDAITSPTTGETLFELSGTLVAVGTTGLQLELGVYTQIKIVYEAIGYCTYQDSASD